jgi:hypothetical protein
MIFHQDRLGANTGEVEKKGALFAGEWRKSCVIRDLNSCRKLAWISSRKDPSVKKREIFAPFVHKNDTKTGLGQT